MLTLKLADDGILDLDEEVNNRLKNWKVPENRWTRTKKVTLRRLLSHQSGLVDPEDSFGLYDMDYVTPRMVDLLKGETPYCPEPIYPNYEPGSDFRYSDTGFCVIQQLIEDVTGSSFDQKMQEEIFSPLGLNNSVLYSSPLEEKLAQLASGHYKKGECVSGEHPVYPYPAAAGLWSTPTDLAKLFIELHQSLSGKGRVGYSCEIIRDMVTPQSCSQWTGLGLFLDPTGEEVEISSLGWGIGFQCLLVGFPHSGNGAVVMTNADLGVHQLNGLIGEIIKSFDWGQN